jgi:hypothetical protein
MYIIRFSHAVLNHPCNRTKKTHTTLAYISIIQRMSDSQPILNGHYNTLHVSSSRATRQVSHIHPSINQVKQVGLDLLGGRSAGARLLGVHALAPRFS